ncbi:hypothetical protein A0H81_14700 [Grifola frondosa]|uniref:Uncharacterized protein n=1 Tax=Grifola frondosa TaxID=5627 RepID=A0A1C7LKJ6_GRIFR|nr:hypothetical protein A0H81_14700 [Grifola frondosa]
MSLSGQLRLRLQYAKLKVEHGWQRQNLNEVENLYFRHTHINRPYPTISPGGRRSRATLANTITPPDVPSPTEERKPDQIADTAMQVDGAPDGSGDGSVLSSHPARSVVGVPDDLSEHVEVPSASAFLEHRTEQGDAAIPGPSHPTLEAALAEQAATGSRASRRNSTRRRPRPASSLPATHNNTAPTENPPLASSTPDFPAANPASSTPTAVAPPPPSTSPFSEPFDPMQPQDQHDTQLAALRSLMSASTFSASPTPAAGAGLTYDSFWSSHSASTSSYRSMLAQAQSRPLVAHASSPAVVESTARDGAGGGAGWVLQ